MESSMCSHVSAMNLIKIKAVLDHLQLHSTPSGMFWNHNNVLCVHCGAIGIMYDEKFLQHLIERNHYLCLRFKDPVELFCSYCGDFQYSKEFDNLIGKKRGFHLLKSNSDSSIPLSSPMSASELNSSHSTSISDEQVDTAISSPTLDIVNQNNSAASPSAISKLQKQLHKLMYMAPRGLCNMGATCFMNSVLQTIIHNPVVLESKSSLLGVNNCTKQLYDKNQVKIPPGISNGCIACDLRGLFIESTFECTVTTAPVVPSNLLFSVWNHANYMAGYEQQDAHEFLIALLDGLSVHLEKYHGEVSTHKVNNSSKEGLASSTNTSRESLNEYTGESSPFHGFVNDTFAGTLQSELLCHTCGHRSCRSEPFLDISLSLPTTATASRNGSILLTDCLTQYTSMETLSELIKCDACNTHQPYYKQLSISELPQVLIIHLKRFDAIKETKLSTHVTFPLTDLNLALYSKPCNSSATSTARSKKNSLNSDSVGGDKSASLYELHGVVTHRGTLNQGHYVSYVCIKEIEEGDGNVNKKWLKCDDEWITVVDSSEVEMCEAYLLFYTRIK